MRTTLLVIGYLALVSCINIVMQLAGMDRDTVRLISAGLTFAGMGYGLWRWTSKGKAKPRASKAPGS